MLTEILQQDAPSVDEEGVMVSFLEQIIDPERPFRPTIDLALARMGSLADLGSAGGGVGAMRNAMMHDHDLGGSPDDMGMDEEHGGGNADGIGAEMGGGGRGGPRGGGELHNSRGISGGGGGGGNHGYGRHGDHSPMAGMGYDEKPRVGREWSRGVGGRDGSVGGYGHELDYGRPPPQMSPWEQEGHGGDMMPKVRSTTCRGAIFFVFLSCTWARVRSRTRFSRSVWHNNAFGLGRAFSFIY